jgi:hypothetical protein
LPKAKAKAAWRVNQQNPDTSSPLKYFGVFLFIALLVAPLFPLPPKFTGPRECIQGFCFLIGCHHPVVGTLLLQVRKTTKFPLIASL